MKHTMMIIYNIFFVVKYIIFVVYCILLFKFMWLFLYFQKNQQLIIFKPSFVHFCLNHMILLNSIKIYVLSTLTVSNFFKLKT